MYVSLKEFHEDTLGFMPVYSVLFSVLIVLLVVTINNNKTFAEPIL